MENSTTIKSDSDYSDIISKPSIRKPLYRDVETVFAIEDQDFLSRLQIVLNKATTPTAKQVKEIFINNKLVISIEFFHFTLKLFKRMIQIQLPIVLIILHQLLKRLSNHHLDLLKALIQMHLIALI